VLSRQSNWRTRYSRNAAGICPTSTSIDAVEFERTLAAALDARDDDNCSSSRGPTRGPRSDWRPRLSGPNRYAQAGADVIFVEAPQSIEEIERIAPRRGGSAADQSGARRDDSAGVRNATAGVGLRHRHSPKQPARPALFSAVLGGACANSTGGGASQVADYCPPRPAEFFNLVGMAEWLALDAKYVTYGGQLMGMTHHREDLRPQGRPGQRCPRARTVIVDVDTTVLTRSAVRDDVDRAASHS